LKPAMSCDALSIVAFALSAGSAELCAVAHYSAALFLGCSPSCASSPGDNDYFKNAKLEVPQSYRTTLRYLLIITPLMMYYATGLHLLRPAGGLAQSSVSRRMQARGSEQNGGLKAAATRSPRHKRGKASRIKWRPEGRRYESASPQGFEAASRLQHLRFIPLRLAPAGC